MSPYNTKDLLNSVVAAVNGTKSYRLCPTEQSPWAICTH